MEKYKEMLKRALSRGKSLQEKLNQSKVTEQEYGGKQQGGQALGPGGNCFCPVCKIEVPHKTNVPCNQTKCPKCGQLMARKMEKTEESKK
jgi:hypothetical protein